MIKRSISYTDLNDKERTEDFYFNLTQAEVVELEVSTEGGLAAYGESLSMSSNPENVLKIFKNLIIRSYGRKSDDGRDFEKSDSLSSKFMTSEAYSVLFMSFLSDIEEAQSFFTGLVPKGMAEQVAKMEAANAAVSKKLQETTSPSAQARPRLTLAEMNTLPKDEIEKRLRQGHMPPTPSL